MHGSGSILALQNIPSQHTKVLILTNFRSLSDGMAEEGNSSYFREFCSLIAEHIAE